MQNITLTQCWNSCLIRFMSDDAIIIRSLARAAKISAGYPLRGSADALKPGDVRFVALKDVSLDSDIDWMNLPSVTLPSTRTPDWLSSDDVIFAARGTRTLAYPVTEPPARAVCAPQFYVIKVKRPEKLLPPFLAWQINQKPAPGLFFAHGHGVAHSKHPPQGPGESPACDSIGR